jgi:hypothetical protein
MINYRLTVTGLFETNQYLRRKINTTKELCREVNVGIGERVNRMLLSTLPVWDGDHRNSITKTEVVFVNTARLWFRFPERHAKYAEYGRPSAKARVIPGNPRHTMRYWTAPHRQGRVIFRKRVGPAPQQPYKVQNQFAIQRTTRWGNSISNGEAGKVVSTWLHK